MMKQKTPYLYYLAHGDVFRQPMLGLHYLFHNQGIQRQYNILGREKEEDTAL